MGDGYQTMQERTKCAVLVPTIVDAGEPMRSTEAQLEEATGLAAAIDLDICFTNIIRITKIKPATLYGSGKVDEIAEHLHDNEIKVTIVDHPLTPVQQRNLERAWQTKVLDRTGIILEIFGARAQTKEGTLQVDLAALNYQRGRLVRSWTHLERQRGGGGFLGGPGETQIESDRRELQMKIERLQKQLDQVRRTRSLHRKQRQKQAIPIIAFVGYTNAGKSTLFNTITNADVFAKDLLFATLDPTLRRLELGDGTAAILSDTVGFISSLPTDLIAAFRATLEEVTEADIIVHVRDISHEDSHAQSQDVTSVLADLDVDIANPDTLEKNQQAYVEVWNKIDLLSDDEKAFSYAKSEGRGFPTIKLISAHTGEGIKELLDYFKEVLEANQTTRTVTLAGEQLANMHYAYSLGTVLSCDTAEDGSVTIKVKSENWEKLNNYMK
ncbi:MAG: GTPase HflX [Hyphomicrobiales bacterium]